jgi:hypothetical protein
MEVFRKVQTLLKISIDCLDQSAQECFAFLAPFPGKPAHFDQKALNAMWQGITADPVQMRNLFVSRGLLEPLGPGSRGEDRYWLHALMLAYGVNPVCAALFDARSASPINDRETCLEVWLLR